MRPDNDGSQQLKLGADSLEWQRAQAVEAVDKLLAGTEATLGGWAAKQAHHIVFSSHNGYHLGQHRFVRGIQTAFDTDIRVPRIVAGPGVSTGRAVLQVTQNIDLPNLRPARGQHPAPGGSKATACYTRPAPPRRGVRASTSDTTEPTTIRPTRL